MAASVVLGMHPIILFVISSLAGTTSKTAFRKLPRALRYSCIISIISAGAACVDWGLLGGRSIGLPIALGIY
ncbi:MAG: hypothetical protein WC371_00755 [Parachlamydiales bacterium]